MAKNCCICGGKIGFKEGTPAFGGELCLSCSAKISYLKDSQETEEVQNAIEYFNPLIQRQELSSEIKDSISASILLAKERITPDQTRQEQEKEISLEQAKRISFIKQNGLITTGYNFENYTIDQYHGLVSGEVVLGTGFLSEFTASFSDLFGTQTKGFAQKMRYVKEAALDQLIKNAAIAGGNAIIGVDFDYITFSSNMIGVSANGTAVEVVRRKE